MNEQRVKCGDGGRSLPADMPSRMEERLLQLQEMKDQEEKRDNSERSSITVSVETELKK